jgi:anti-sigma factor RsiW
MSAANAGGAPPRGQGPPGEHPGDLLSGLLDGELDLPTMDVVEQHVDGCAACRAELDGLAEVRRALRGAPVMPAPPGYLDRVVARRRRSIHQGVAITAIAASVAAVLGMAVAATPGPQPAPVASSWSTSSAGAAGGQLLDDVRATLADPSGQQGSEGSGATGSTGDRRVDAHRPGPDDRIADRPRHGVPSAGDEDSLLERAHEIGGELLDLLGG